MTPQPSAARASQRIDWSEIHQRVEAAREALAQGAAPNSQESRAILRTRARTLAQERVRAGSGTSLVEIVEFSLGAEIYGFESNYVREVYPLKAFTPLPGLPPFVLGIVNVRGQILSIVDLRKFFELPERGLGQLNKLLILRTERMELGILADDILGARSIELDGLRGAPPTVSGMGAKYVRGVTYERVILLDAGKLLSDKQIIVHQPAE